MFKRFSNQILVLLIAILSATTAKATASAQSQQVTLNRQGAGTLYVNATIDHFLSASFLMDTGSGLVTLNKQTFAALAAKGNLISIGDIAARMANGQIQKMKRYRVASIVIGDRCELGPLDIAVIPSGANILGINALLKAAPITIDHNSLTLSGCKS